MPSNTQYVPPVEWFSNTDEFRERAIYFSELINGKARERYTDKLKGTQEYLEFWKEEDRKCREGMTNSKGIRITGIHYFYLNYVQIKLKDKATGRKRKGFPRFLDVDYDFFHLVDVAREKKKGLIFSKPRRGGFSFKDSAVVAHEYNFFRDSTCVIGAYLGQLADQTMNMVLDNLNFLNAHTEWRKQRNPDTKELVKARFESYVDGVKVWKGYNSEVMKITFKDNPYASIGKSTSVFIFEEAGKFANLKESFNLTEPCWKDGDDMIGIPIVFGTGGDMEAGTADFGYMFYNPRVFNFLEFNNVWDEGKENTTCGWFIPATRGRLGEDLNDNRVMVDDDGNSLEDIARESIMHLREIKKSTGDSQAIKDTITQFPLTPAESFLRSSGAIFSSIEMHEWLSKVETTPSLRNNKKKVELYFDDAGNIKSKLNPDLEDVVDFPLNKEKNKKGCIVIWDEPSEHAPYGRYIAGVDPYDQDKAESSESLGSFLIYDRMSDQFVAEFTGRPERADDFYETCRRMCIYYNAKVLYENQLKGLKGYFEMKNSLHYLWEQPQIIKDIVKDSRVNRGYGIHMNRGSGGATGIKDQCEIYLKQWLYEERQDSDGNKTFNLNTILSIPLLKELIAYDRETNTDRVIAMMLCILQSKEMHKIHLQSTQPKTLLEMDSFFSKKYFQKNVHNKLRY